MHKQPTTQTFPVYLYYIEQYSQPGKPFFKLTETDNMANHGWLLVKTIPVTVELPDMDAMLQKRLDALDRAERDMKAQYAAAMTQFARKRNELLALENCVEAA